MYVRTLRNKISLSTVASVKDATKFTHGQAWVKSFNPRTRKGCDPFVGVAPPAQKRFNPRTRKGCDKFPI